MCGLCFLAKKHSLSGGLIGFLHCTITWSLWNNRCKARMEGITVNKDHVWRMIKSCIPNIAHELKINKKLAVQDFHIMKELNIKPLQVQNRKCRVVWWLKHPSN